MMLVFRLVAFLMVSEAWSLNSETNHNTSVNTNTSTPDPEVHVTRNEFFRLGTDVKLTCTNKTWSEMIYTIWTIESEIEIKLNNTPCKIGFSNGGESHNSCNNDKALLNTSSGESYLLIPDFSNSDEGVYKCETVYKAASTSVYFHVSATVPPSVSAWLKRQGGKTVAVCLAKEGKPAASVSWRNTGNSSSIPRFNTLPEPDGSYTVESKLEFSEGVMADNLICAVAHTSWEQEQLVKPERESWTELQIAMVIACPIIAILLGILCITWHCWQPTTAPSESKPPPIEDVEEVEPYASYVQHVNSIYNSSADLFT
ncbi:cell surface glycoprotein CD200 receptor 1 [Polymixia lowei]